MLILAIETSAAPGSVALCRGAECLFSTTLEGASRRHAQMLVSRIDEGLRTTKLRAADLEGIAVSVGPGSFTGLRVGVVCAKTLAFAVGKPLAAVDTLEAIAANSPPDVQVVSVVSDAQRGDLYVGTYRQTGPRVWRPAGEIEIKPAEEWLSCRGPGEVLSGPGLAPWQERIPAGVRVLPGSAWVADARAVAAIGARRILDGQTADPFLLEPVYIRRSAAEERAG